MRKILIVLLLIIGVAAQGQGNHYGYRNGYLVTIPGYTNIFARYKWIAIAADSGMHVPQYNGVPSGVRVGVWSADGAISMDTTTGYFYGYFNGAWVKMAKFSDVSGTVTSVSGLSPLFTVSNATTTPTFSLISQSQNLVFASPNGSSGVASFRALTVGDLPGLSTLAWSPTGNTGLNATTNFIGNNDAVEFNVRAGTDGHKMARFFGDNNWRTVINDGYAMSYYGLAMNDGMVGVRYTVTSYTSATKKIVINGVDLTALILPGDGIKGYELDNIDDEYEATVSTVTFTGGNTEIVLTTDPIGGNGSTMWFVDVTTVNTIASRYGVSVGDLCVSEAGYTFTSGKQTWASGQYSAAFNYSSVASGVSSNAFSNGRASGIYGFAASNGAATGDYSFALGNDNISSGKSSFSTGNGNHSKSFGGAVVGVWNDSTSAADPIAFNTANRAFQIGIGASTLARKNAMTVLFSGRTGFGTTTPVASALVEMSDTAKGILIPRMTTTQRNAISSPAIGLLIYNTTDSAFSYYKLAGWSAIGSGGGGSQTPWTSDINADGFTLYGDNTANGTLTLSGNNAGAGNTAGNANILLKTGNTPTTAVSIDNEQVVTFSSANMVGIAMKGSSNPATTLIRMGEYGGASTYGSMWYGNSATSTANYILAGDGADNLFNATSQVYFAIGGSTKAYLNTTGFYTNVKATFGTTNAIVGTATNNNADAGNLGERQSSTQSTYANFTTSATYQNIDSITLTAGDWDVSAFFTYSSNSATITAASNAIFLIGTASAASTGATEGLNINYVPQAALLGTSKFSDAIPPFRVSLAGTTKYYLNAQATFTIGNPQFVGTIRAVRVR